MEIIYLQKLIEQRLSTREIAKICNTSQTNIRYWLKKHNLKTLRDYLCTKCGENNPKKFYGHKKDICGNCHNLYVVEKGKDVRHRIISHMGGKCIICKFDKFECSMHVHHIDPNTKDINFSSHRGWSWNRILNEIQNCVLVCANCHSAIHAGLIELP